MKRRFALPFLLCCSGLAAADPPALQIAGRPVQLSLTAISAHTVQITVAPLDLYRTPQPVPDDPVLVSRVWPAPAFRLRSVLPAETVRVGGMQVTVTPESLKLSFARSSGGQFQQIAIDPKDGSVSSHIGSEPLFGLGEGGPQFDRHGLYPGNDLNGSPHNPAVFIRPPADSAGDRQLGVGDLRTHTVGNFRPARRGRPLSRCGGPAGASARPVCDGRRSTRASAGGVCGAHRISLVAAAVGVGISAVAPGPPQPGADVGDCPPAARRQAAL